MATTENAIATAIAQAIPDAKIEVGAGSGGHYTLTVISPVFSGKSMLESQRLVYSAIAHLMKGAGAPVHAIDSLKTRTP